MREKKGFSAIKLKSKGLTVKQIALLIYNDHSERAQNRVRALISKFRRRKLQKKLRLRKSGSEVAPSGSQPQLRTRASDYEKLLPKSRKRPEMVEKGKASETVLNWLDQDAVARQLADECYENAKQCVQEREFENACRFLELVSRFLRLSQSARREFDLEEMKRALVEEYE